MDRAGSDGDPTTGPREPLRIAVVVDGGDAPAWVARVLRDIRDSDVAWIAVVLQRPATQVARPNAVVRALHGLYDAIDARAVRVARDAFAPEDIVELLGQAPVFELDANGGIDDRARRLVEALALDAVIELGHARLDDQVLPLVRSGVWSVVHGDHAADLGGPPGAHEIWTRAPVTETALVARTTGGARTLVRSWSATDPSSVRRGRSAMYWKASAFVIRALRALYAGDLARVAPSDDRPGEPSAPSTSTLDRSVGGRDPACAADGTRGESPPGTARASSTRALAGFARFGAAMVRDRAQRLTTRKQWLLAYGIDPTRTGDVPSRAIGELRWIVPPRDRFWADPFVARHGDGWVVVFEDKRYADPHARISALEIARDGTVGEPFSVLERDHHLSYPFLFHWNQTWWMIPESSRNATVDLWRAVDFPRRWTLERTLLSNTPAVDATLLEHDGRWWMFCNIGEPGASKDDELHLFHAATPLGPWSPHPGNPIKSDIRGARPAGRPFRDAGAWIRPAQDSSAGYGSSIVLQRIERLDLRGYAEVEHARLAPSFAPGLIGLHTINAADGLTVVDLRIERSRLALLDRRR